MILGDPYKFAIIIKVVEEWNVDETFCNGILLFCVNGNIFPQEVLTATLNSEIKPMKENLKKIAISNEIFNLEKEEAFKKIYNMTFPEDFNVDNDYQFDITPLSFADDNCYIFAVSNDTRIRILAAKLKYAVEISKHLLENADIEETFLSVQEMEKIAEALRID